MNPAGRAAVGILALVAFGCSASPRPHARIAARPEAVNGSSISSGQMKSMLERHYRRWEGVPHRLGGYSQQGIDCSGFAHVTYYVLFDMNLPRTTSELATVGRRVERSALAPGDLVFFHPPSYARHVGIYLGNGRFMHASSSQGVMISDMGDAYWRDNFWTARRVVATGG